MNVLTHDDGAVRTITLNRPDVRNAIDIPLRVELAQAITAADDDASVRAIVLTGAGRVFCSGGDIATMRRMPEDEAMERAELAMRVIKAIWGTAKPVIAAVEGAAFGAGVALAAACDRVVAARDARFATTFTNVGLAGDMGIFASLPVASVRPRPPRCCCCPNRSTPNRPARQGWWMPSQTQERHWKRPPRTPVDSRRDPPGPTESSRR
jgi:enoyl-CoA hydratase/carnithine racemase